MHEKTLLYGALAATAIAATFGVLHGRGEGGRTNIAPVSQSDHRLVPEAEIPIRLTSSDGTGLVLSSLKASAVLEDPLALTELHLVFENPEDRVLEGTFRIALPQGASLSRFAMKIGETWQEGEVVEKQKARQTYEDFLHRRQDPALMEQGAGNEFTARVFPIPARGKKEIKIAYSEVVEASAPYVLPLRGLPQLGALDVDVHATGAKANAVFGLHQTQFRPAADFVVDAPKLPRSPGLRAGDVALARVVPYQSSRPDPITSAVFLVDTSASRALGLADQVSVVQQTIARLAPATKIVVAAFDQEVVQVYEGAASGFGTGEARALTKRGALGASDFEQAIVWAGENAKRIGAKRVVVIGDGVATAGETDTLALKTKIEKLRPAGVERIDAIALGGIRDDAFLRGVVRGVLDKDGTVLDAKLGPDALARRLAESTSSGVPVKVAGATWSWPTTIDGLQAGDEVIVFATLPEGKPFEVEIGTQKLAPDLRTIERPLVERAWAQARIQSMLEAPTADPATTRRDIVALSTRHRVLSPHTALLVLETEWDYRRYGIERNANVDILTVRDGKLAVELGDRRNIVEKPPVVPPETAAEDSKGLLKTKNNQQEQKPVTGVAASAAPVVAVPPAEPAPAPNRAGEKVEDQFETTLAEEAKKQGGHPDGPRPDDQHRGPSQPTTDGPRKGSGRLELGQTDPDLPRATATATAAAAAATPPPPPARPRPTPRPPSNTPTTPPAPHQTAQTGWLNGVDGDTVSGSVRHSTLTVESGIAHGEAQRVLRQAIPGLRACYMTALRSAPSMGAHFEIAVVIDPLGQVKSVTPTTPLGSRPLETCAVAAIRGLRFPAPGSSDARFRASFDFVPGQGDATDTNGAASVTPSPEQRPEQAAPYDGRFKIVMDHLARGAKDAAFDEANRWRTDEPGDVLALVALGEVMEARGDIRTAARAYGSILELFSFRADSRRFAAERLERLADPLALRLATDSYAKAALQRADHPASHRLLGFALLKRGEHEKAFHAIAAGLAQRYPPGRFAGYDRILKEDLGLVAAAWIKAAPERAAEIRKRLHDTGGIEESSPSLRFVLNWETDANDVDFHIYDGRGGHAYFSQRSLPSGGELYADVTTGYGPECFTIRNPREKRAYPYTLQAHYYSRGPMGYGMGKLEIVDHDGRGNLTFEERPFVVMKDRAYVDLGKIEKPRPNVTASLP